MLLLSLAIAFPLLAAGAYCGLDALLRRRIVQKQRDALLYQVFVFAVVAASLSGPWTTIRILLVLLFALMFAVGHGYRKLTGDTLRPEGLILGSHPDHLADALEVAWTDFGRARDVAAAVAGWTALALAGTLALPPPDLGWPIGLLGPALLVLTGVRAMRLRNNAAYPTPGMPVLIAVVNALALAGKWTVLVRREGGRPDPIRYSYRFSEPEDDVLVVVLMGESISPDRMSLFLPDLTTTPRLLARAKGEGRLAMFWRVGLSGGVASNASLTALLSGLQRPELGTEHRTLFELAKAQGFRTHYISPQPRSPLDMTGRLHALDTVDTRENNQELIRRRSDYMINDKLRALALSGRDFFFLYQRVNHAPYRTHDEAGLQRGIHNPKTREEITHNYDLGLDAWDRHVDSVLGDIEERLNDKPQTRCFVFVSSDHNELLGEGGFWGHNISGRIDCAVVPMLLFTNAPKHHIARSFAAAGKFDAFDLSRAVLTCVGVGLATQGGDDTASYVGNALPYGRAGYMTAHRAPDGSLDVTVISQAGRTDSRHLLSPRDTPGDRGYKGSPGLFSCRADPSVSLGEQDGRSTGRADAPRGA